MRPVNKATLIGNVGTDVDKRHTTNGQAVANFRIATNEKWKSGDDWQERTEWHRIVAWGKLAEIAAEYVRKGSPVYIEGRIQTREWEDKNGSTRYTTEIVAQELILLGNREGAGTAPRQSPATPKPSTPKPAPAAVADDDGRGDFFGDDSDLPF